MMPDVTANALAAPAAFDLIAERYDDTFTRSTIGKLQRGVVWEALTRAFSPGDFVLELNCGTGEDALFLARRGVSLTACDASAAMIAIAQRRKAREAADAKVEFRVLANENLGEMRESPTFDGAFSNFSGLNCVADTHGVAASLGVLLKPGARLVICLSTRVCLWEMCWYLAHGNLGKAFRRARGRTIANLQGVTVPVWYPTIGQTRRRFAPWFRLRSVQAVGLFVPPSYVESWAQKHGRYVAALAKLDRLLARVPIMRAIGDHVLLEFERVAS
jgi:ubiquinone/menaquinone biosynthesis C-methylase UbiE